MRARHLLLLVLAAGCARRPHTRSDFGVSNRAFFNRQARASEKGSGQGLDSEEAATIQKRYHQNLGNTSQRPNDPRSSVLILEDTSHAAPRK